MSKHKNKARRSAPASSTPGDNASRINKVLAAAGLGSRRHVEELIVQGRVEIDGQVITNLGTRVDPSLAKIKVDGVLLKRPRMVYYALNKPKGVLSTNSDPSGRRRVIDYVPDQQRVFSVGRLDLYSEGLVLLTNDGNLAQRLAHPRFRVQKTYFVVVAGAMTVEELDQLRKGVYLSEGVARIDGARIRKTRKSCTELEIQLSEGKNREIRRILARAGHKVVLLRRVAIGPLRLGELPVGVARPLTSNEVRALYLATSASSKGKSPRVAGPQAKRTKPTDSRHSLDEESAPKTAVGSKTAVQTGRMATPLEFPVTDDFGIGLEDDAFVDQPLLPAEIQFDQESLSAPDEYLDETESQTDEEWDDDFAIDFSEIQRTGSIIGDEPISPKRGHTAGRSKRPLPKTPGRRHSRSGKSADRPASSRSRSSSTKSVPSHTVKGRSTTSASAKGSSPEVHPSKERSLKGKATKGAGAKPARGDRSETKSSAKTNSSKPAKSSAKGLRGKSPASRHFGKKKLVSKRKSRH